MAQNAVGCTVAAVSGHTSPTTIVVALVPHTNASHTRHPTSMFSAPPPEQILSSGLGTAALRGCCARLEGGRLSNAQVRFGPDPAAQLQRLAEKLQSAGHSAALRSFDAIVCKFVLAACSVHMRLECAVSSHVQVIKNTASKL